MMSVFKLIMLLLIGLGLVLGGLYVVNAQLVETNATTHPTIDKASREALLKELTREEEQK
tara:strand:- start:3506 stop:3685 length:180 start_codon:yes stop_codon:yes gene_type:complete